MDLIDEGITSHFQIIPRQVLKDPVSYYRVLSCGRTQDFKPKGYKKGGVFMNSIKSKDGKLYKLVFCKYIRKNGKVIYPKKAKVFKIWIPVDSAA